MRTTNRCQRVFIWVAVATCCAAVAALIYGVPLWWAYSSDLPGLAESPNGNLNLIVYNDIPSSRRVFVHLEHLSERGGLPGFYCLTRHRYSPETRQLRHFRLDPGEIHITALCPSSKTYGVLHGRISSDEVTTIVVYLQKPSKWDVWKSGALHMGGTGAWLDGQIPYEYLEVYVMNPGMGFI